MKPLYTLLIGSLLFTGCHHSLSGRYRVAGFKGVVNTDSMGSFLRNSLLNKQFDLTVDSSLTTIRSVETRNQFTLKRWKNAKLLTYLTHFNIDGISYSVILKRDTGFQMDVSVGIPYDMTIPNMIPVQLNMLGNTARWGKDGRIQCLLERVDN